MNHLKYIILFATSYCALNCMQPPQDISTVPSLIAKPDPAGFTKSKLSAEKEDAGRRYRILELEVRRLLSLDPLQHPKLKKRSASLLNSCYKLLNQYGTKYPDIKAQLDIIAKTLI